MQTQERRAAILARLQTAETPVSAGALARQFAVSRQVIVNDVAMLRAGGADVCATPRGYQMLPRALGLVRRVACRHGADAMEAELLAIVRTGCTVADVIVEHPLYGQLTGVLQLASETDVQHFLVRCRTCAALPLSLLTDGVHLHTLLCPGEDAYLQAKQALAALGVLLQDAE